MTNQELHILVAAVAPALATLTGQMWHYVTPPGGEEISRWSTVALNGPREDTPNISIQYSGRDNKLHVRGTFPRGDRGDYGPYRGRQSIGVSVTKSATSIACDIARRFLPDYLAAHAKALESKRRDAEARGKGLAVAEALQEILGQEIRDDHDKGWIITRYRSADHPDIRVEVDQYQPDRRVKITLDDLTQGEAAAVLAVLPKET